ncbi:MAG: hypothetical protein JRI91_00995 [Deltaproteobacteria bacterium]|nr:hypothetical protein [Deltaproteobacteria bacterium]
MNYDPEKHHRRSIRLGGYDYSQAGFYFVTICTQNQKCLFGHIADKEMVLNDAGRTAEKCWNNIPKHFPRVKLDKRIIMPNHIHGILSIMDTGVGAKNLSPLQSRPYGTSKTIGSVVRGFKIGVTKWFRSRNPGTHVWQRNYYEHIVHNEIELNQIRKYILNNPIQWELDRENPDVVRTKNLSPLQYKILY